MSIEKPVDGRDRAHRNAKAERDARDSVTVGTNRRVVIDSAPGEGREPEKGLGYMNGIRVFVEFDPHADRADVDADEAERYDVVEVMVTDVKKNVVHAVAVTKLKSLGSELT